jgi:hypothetical protein
MNTHGMIELRSFLIYMYDDGGSRAMAEQQ